MMTKERSVDRTRRVLPIAIAVVCLVLFYGDSPLRADQPAPDPFKDQTLASAIERLQKSGLKVIFSSKLVHDGMLVESEPTGRWPREILDEILAPHGLMAKRGPSGTLLIVSAPTSGSIRGIVKHAGTREAVVGVLVVASSETVSSINVETESDDEGGFKVGPLEAGSYTIEVSRLGYLPLTLDDVPVTAGSVTEIRLEISPPYMHVEKIVVRAEDPSSQRDRPESRDYLNGEDLAASPEFGGDPLSSVKRLPGVTGSDGAGSLNVRGGSDREAKIILDGLELYEPYHLKDRGGPISLIDSRNIGGIGFLGGAFPAEYGGHMSAVVEMETTPPADDLATEVSASTDHARLASEGTLGERMQWLVSARRGDPTRFLDALGADPSYRPAYWDLFGKSMLRLNDKTTLSFNMLAGDDEMEGGGKAEIIETSEEPGTFRSEHKNRYLWLTLDHVLTPNLISQTVVSSGHLISDRSGSNPRVTEVRDYRSTEVLALKQSFLLQSDRHLVKWGLDFKQLGADYDYSSTPPWIASSTGIASFESANEYPATPDSVAINKSTRGSDVGLYLSDRLSFNEKLNVELGLRWDFQSYTPGTGGTLSPRFNAVYAFDDRTTLRAGWGYFYQPQQIHEMQVEDGVEEFLPSEQAEHRIISLERELRPFGDKLLLQINAYQKLMHDLNPRYENLYDPFGFFPESGGDRVLITPDAARAEGLELVLRRPVRKTLGWWASYSLSRAEDEVKGDWIPRSWDQRHTINAGLRWRPSDGWDFSMAGSYHSGRPTTPVTAETRHLWDGSSEIVPFIGERNSERFPAYRRLDLEASRLIPIRGTYLRATLTLTNVFNHKNPSRVADFDYIPLPDGTVAVQPHLRNGLSRLVTFGLSWKF